MAASHLELRINRPAPKVSSSRGEGSDIKNRKDPYSLYFWLNEDSCQAWFTIVISVIL